MSETDTPKWRYSFYVWPDETWGSDYMPGTQKIPSAVFALFRQWNARIEVQMTALEFVRYRHDLGTFGLTLREIMVTGAGACTSICQTATAK